MSSEQNHWVMTAMTGTVATVVGGLILYFILGETDPIPPRSSPAVLAVEPSQWRDDFSDGEIDPAKWYLNECDELPYERDGILNFMVASPRTSDSYQCLPALPFPLADIEEVSAILSLRTVEADDKLAGVGLGANLSDGRYISAELRLGPGGVGVDIVLCKDDSSDECDDLANLPRAQKEVAKPVNLKIARNGSLTTIFVDGIAYPAGNTPITKVELHLWANAGSAFHVTADDFFMRYRT